MAKQPSDQVVLEFLSDAEALQRRPIPLWINHTLYLLLGLVGFAIAWAALARIDMLVVAPGKLTTTPASLVVQPIETGVVRSIEVVVGQTVRQGQVLATLDATFAAADLSQLKTKAGSLTWQVRRLNALLVPAGHLEADPASPASQLQKMIFEQQKEAYKAQLAEYDSVIQRLNDQLAHSKTAHAVLEERLKTLNEIVNIQEQLKDSGGGSRYKLLISLDSYQGMMVELQREANQTADLQQQVLVQTAQREFWIQDWRQKLTTELQTAQRDLDETSQQLEKAEHRAQLIALTAPSPAIVLDLAPRPVGSVVKEAEPLITLVPLDTPLTAEVEIPDRQIGYIHVGQTARIKVDAFPFQLHGTLPATLQTVSADAFVKEQNKGEPIYRARLSLDSLNLANMKPNTRLLPGATIQAEIIVGRRSVLSYCLYPLLKSLNESLHEP